MMAGLAQLASWYAYAARTMALDTWRALPGPWWARILLLVALAAIPGCFDELALIAVLKFARMRSSRRIALASQGTNHIA